MSDTVTPAERAVPAANAGGEPFRRRGGRHVVTVSDTRTARRSTR
jgi:hypothetical protein